MVKGRPQFWTWLNADDKVSDNEIYSFYKMMHERGVDGVLPSGNNNYYKRVGPICKDIGLEFHPWRWTVNRGEHKENHPDWYAVSREGKSTAHTPPYVDYYRWLCPSRQESIDLITNDYINLCQIEGVSGVHLDYVRYCDVILPIALQPKYNLVQDHEMAEYDFCYCSTCRENFARDHGYDPLSKSDPTQDDLWRQWRLDQVVNLVNGIVREIHKKGKEISGAVFPTPAIARYICKQDWERFNLDTYMPMMYFKDYDGDLDWLERVIDEDLAVLKGSSNLFAGLNMSHVQSYGLERVMKIALARGVQGITLFTGNSLSKEEWDIFEKIAHSR